MREGEQMRHQLRIDYGPRCGPHSELENEDHDEDVLVVLDALDAAEAQVERLQAQLAAVESLITRYNRAGAGIVGIETLEAVLADPSIEDELREESDRDDVFVRSLIERGDP